MHYVPINIPRIRFVIGENISISLKEVNDHSSRKKMPGLDAEIRAKFKTYKYQQQLHISTKTCLQSEKKVKYFLSP